MSDPPRVSPPTDRLAEASRGLSWLFLLGFLLLEGAARGVYVARGVAPSARFEAVAVVGFFTFLWYWIRQQCEPYNVKFPLDFAWFMAFLWYFLAPYYLWRTQRWRGLGKFGVLLAAVVLSYLASMTVAFVLGQVG